MMDSLITSVCVLVCVCLFVWIIKLLIDNYNLMKRYERLLDENVVLRGRLKRIKRNMEQTQIFLDQVEEDAA